MSDKKILVPVDFTELSYKVIEQAAIIGKAAGAELLLLHITNRSDDIDLVKSQLTNKAVETALEYRVVCKSRVVRGSIFKDIQEEAEDNDYTLMVIGTHGVKGLKQKLLGADILKIITKISVPTLVVQSTSPHRETFNKIVMPVATHLEYENILKAVVTMAKIFQSEVQIYSIERPGYEWPDQLLRNLEKTKALFEHNGIKYKRVNEKQTVLSVGFARQTLQYAQNAGADMIAMMSVSSEDYHYFAVQDKENLLTNESGIPVLCASNLVKY